MLGYGAQRTTGPGRFGVVAGEAFGKFQELLKIHNDHDWNGLIEESDKQIVKTPEWLTPYYFKAIGLANMGKKPEALALLEHVDKQTQGNKQFDDVRRVLKQLRDSQ